MYIKKVLELLLNEKHKKEDFDKRERVGFKN